MSRNKPYPQGNARGRTNIPPHGDARNMDHGKGALPAAKRKDMTHPIGRGGGKNRGDRTDMSKVYSGTSRRQPNRVDPTGPGSRQRDR